MLFPALRETSGERRKVVEGGPADVESGRSAAPLDAEPESLTSCYVPGPLFTVTLCPCRIKKRWLGPPASTHAGAVPRERRPARRSQPKVAAEPRD
ncbi:hypothetical protein SKAU_G00064970 [Synaphobranchus kaupii]|uniref:Uncharacterized protein n=1 Tax=Synaphobranchus kaupii TaxID=118154 RepID=A0A9Q1JB57_SYNKA|nr:hypothetical protein SKAU_G00064970 [Synaphobranchus kaupii]